MHVRLFRQSLILVLDLMLQKPKQKVILVMYCVYLEIVVHSGVILNSLFCRNLPESWVVCKRQTGSRCLVS